MHPDPFAAFNPNGDALLRRISKHVDDPTLNHIAKLDPVGSYVREHLRELRKIRDRGIIERPLQWKPREVLEFSGWSEPDAQDRAHRQWELRGTQGHWARAFSCAVLMRAYGDVETRQTCAGVYNPALIQMLESVRGLEAGLEPEAMAALAWFIMRLHTSNEAGLEDEIALAGVGLLSLAVRSRDTVQDADILKFAEWLLAEEKQARKVWGEGIAGDIDWLLRTPHFMFLQKWLALAAELAAFDAAGPCGDAVRSIGQRLAG